MHNPNDHYSIELHPNVQFGTGEQALIHLFQQPPWPDRREVELAKEDLSQAAPVVDSGEIRALDEALGKVRAGDRHLLQLGDCMETIDDQSTTNSTRLCEFGTEAANSLRGRDATPAVLVLRTAGQFAKPRSRPYELIDGEQLPVFRGHIVNDPDPDARSRRPKPKRMLLAHKQAVRSASAVRNQQQDSEVWLGHEAMLLPYEYGLIRKWDSHHYGSSGHFLWIGDRTRQPESPLVELLAGLRNPVGFKVGPSADPDEIALVVDRLTDRSERHVVLIVRLGLGTITDLLPQLLDAVDADGKNVIWIVDPLHGNHEQAASGVRTRNVEKAIEETELFVDITRSRGVHPGGLHLEATWDSVYECIDNQHELPNSNHYRSLMDPRLNPHQTDRVIRAFKARTEDR